MLPPTRALGSLDDQVPPAGLAFSGMLATVSQYLSGASCVRLTTGKGLIISVVSFCAGQPVAMWS